MTGTRSGEFNRDEPPSRWQLEAIIRTQGEFNETLQKVIEQVTLLRISDGERKAEARNTAVLYSLLVGIVMLIIGYILNHPK